MPVKTNMAAATFTHIPFKQDSLSGFPVEESNCRSMSSNDRDDSDQTRLSLTYRKRSEMEHGDLLSARERDRIRSRKRRQKADIENLKKHGITGGELTVSNITDTLHQKSEGKNDANSCKGNTEAKKKRNVRKRNRSDMSPEELRRLRERERKAQQSRRDRIRAQKRQAQGWHDDDAAWEAFLDQTENSNPAPINEQTNKKLTAAAIPSMVCSISPHNGPENRFVNNEPSVTEGDQETLETNIDVLGNKDIMIQKQDSTQSNETDSNSYQDGLSNTYSSDENNQDGSLKENLNGKRGSRRHNLPSEELEKLRKRERDAKRKQREKHRQANMESNSPNRLKENSDLQKETHTEPLNHQDDATNTASEFDRSPDQMQVTKPQELKNPAILSSASPRPHLTPPSFHKLSPHVHHIPFSPHHHYPPVVYLPDSHYHHHYSPSSHYINEGHHYHDMHYPPHLAEDRRYHSGMHDMESHKSVHDQHGRHLISPHPMSSSHHNHTLPLDSSSPEQKHISAPPVTASPSVGSAAEKKRMISRNVDRKKLSEEELEELRRRERDYQRERRARIRMEKAKSQASHEHFHQKAREEGVRYYSPAPMYHPHSLHRHHDEIHMHHHDKIDHVPSRYESDERFDYRQHMIEKDFEEHTRSIYRHSEELAVSIPSDTKSGRTNTEINGTEPDLLQVVPKNRECEDLEMEEVSPQRKLKASPTPCHQSKKSVLENICSSLKKDSPEWNESVTEDDDDDDENKLVIVQPNTEPDKKDISSSSIESDENFIKLKEELTNGINRTEKEQNGKPNDDRVTKEKITEDQLERRRRSNREAQRRRRARLKMQGSSEDQPDSSMEQSGESNDVDSLKEKILNGSCDDDKNPEHMRGKGCRVKVTPARPDSLYPDDYPYYHSHRPDKLDRHYMHEKYGHYIHDPYLYTEKHIYYPPHRSVREIEDIPRGHFFHEPAFISDRHIHDFPHYYRHHSHYLRDVKGREHYDRHQVSPIDRHYMEVRENGIEEEKHKPLAASASTSPSSNIKVEAQSPSSNVKLESESDSEPLKLTGRKRKQCAPRKVVSSSNTPEEDVDVCTTTPDGEVIRSDTLESNKRLKEDGGNDVYDDSSTVYVA